MDVFLGFILGAALASVGWSIVMVKQRRKIDSLRTQLWDNIIHSPDRYGP